MEIVNYRKKKTNVRDLRKDDNYIQTIDQIIR